MNLPSAFEEKMRGLLQEEFDEYIACYEEPRYYGLRVNTAKITVEEFERICPFEITPIPWIENGFYYDGENVAPAKHPYYFAGLYYLQEPSAMTPASRLPVEPGDKVLDVCAAPGGKSFSAAFAMEDQGEILACDLHENKLKRIREGAERLGLACIQTTAADGRGFRPEWEARFDVVLVDAPCSGFGIIRKKPDVRYKKPDDLFALPVIQRAILDNAARYVRPGGTLVYSTCTILPEENEGVSDSFLAEHPDFCRTPFSLSGPVGETEGQVTLWPHRHGTDGFYICRMTRN